MEREVLSLTNLVLEFGMRRLCASLRGAACARLADLRLISYGRVPLSFSGCAETRALQMVADTFFEDGPYLGDPIFSDFFRQQPEATFVPSPYTHTNVAPKRHPATLLGDANSGTVAVRPSPL